MNQVAVKINVGYVVRVLEGPDCRNVHSGLVRAV